ncbi:MAG: quinol:cytochrome C oxidoreductase [Cytophagales bacterium]|nr:MAG: quinol:cytochrome C oxidoreductase [Cytophagales bacterium]
MGAHKTISLADEKMQYEFTAKLKSRLMMTLGIGVVMLILGIILLSLGIGEAHHAAEHGKDAAKHSAEHGHHHYHWFKRVIANLWLNATFFNGIALIGVFFLSFNYVAHAGWSVIIKRVPETFGEFLPISMGAILSLFLLQIALGDDFTLFHWTHAGITDPNSKNYDAIIAGKSGFLNVPFFIARMAIFFSLWYFLFRRLRSFSLQEEQITDFKGYLKNPTIYNKAVYTSAIFLVVFAVSESVIAWDWLMSIDVHWFSTMFGWQNFASWFVSGLATITLTVILLKEQGYLKSVTKHHLHDLGKFMFAFSVFWAYVTFCQFLLIYYAHIPEETTYFNARLNLWDGYYRFLFYFNFFINFAFPLLVLMAKEAKRTTVILKVVAGAILVGHYLDFYLIIMPGTIGDNSGFGFVEIGCILIFASLFIYTVAHNLTKAPMIAKNHPFIKESQAFSQFN